MSGPGPQEPIGSPVGAGAAGVTVGDGDAPLPDLLRQVLVLRAGAERLGLVIEEVGAVVEPRSLSVVPKAPPAIRGIMNHVGEVLTVASLPALIGLEEAAGGPGPGLVVVVERRDVRLGLLVDRIEGITRTVDLERDLGPEPRGPEARPAGGGTDGRPSRPARPLPFARGWLVHDGSPLAVLDGGAIVDDVLARFERGDRRG